MNICDKEHDEVCFDAQHCPVCELILVHNQAITELDQKIDSLSAEIEELQEKNQ
jgi:hypothetical protein